MADYILNMGGWNATGCYNTVDIFKATENSVEKVTGHGLSLSEARDESTAASCGDYVFAMGGWNGSSFPTAIDVFKVTENGVEAVTGHGLTLSQGRSYLASASCGNYILAMGGVPAQGLGLSNAVDVFKVTENGVEAVTDHGLTLSVARGYLAAASAGNYILAMGGSGSGSYSNVVDVFKVTADGVEAVTDHGLTLSVARELLTAASCGDYIFAMGGYDTTGCYNTVDIFKATENGVEAVTDHGLSLSTARIKLASAACGDYILAMGGSGRGPTYLNTVDVFHVTENGVEAVTGHGLSLRVARDLLTAASCGDYILAMGGYDGNNYKNTVDVFQILN